MYSFLLVVSMLFVVLSPLLLDTFLSLQEMGAVSPLPRHKKEEGPQIAWASSRNR